MLVIHRDLMGIHEGFLKEMYQGLLGTCRGIPLFSIGSVVLAILQVLG